MSESDTPMTDAEAELRGGSLLVRADFARQLERDKARLVKAMRAMLLAEFGSEFTLDDMAQLGAGSYWTTAANLLIELGEQQ